jgi:hypothetical protein
MGEGEINVLTDVATYKKLQFLHLKALDVFMVALSFVAQRHHLH